MLRKVKEPFFIVRFKEFDEARIYIEDMKQDKNLVINAIDYMIFHKEYYFLLKHLYRQFGNIEFKCELFDYIFLNLQGCPRRKEGIELYYKILKGKNIFLKESLKEFLKSCSCKLLSFLNRLLTEDSVDLKLIAIESFKYCPEESIKESLKNDILKESNPQVIDKFLEYMQLYCSEEDLKWMLKFKKKNPSFEEKIDSILKGL
jgi:hypothetical protein